MTDFYIRNARVWVKVSRSKDKSFSFHTGYTGEMRAFKTLTYPCAFMPTIADARTLAKTIAADYI